MRIQEYLDSKKGRPRAREDARPRYDCKIMVGEEEMEVAEFSVLRLFPTC